MPVPTIVDATGRLFEAYDAAGGATYVLRPDGHVCGRTRSVSAKEAAALVGRAIAASDPR